MKWHLAVDINKDGFRTYRLLKDERAVFLSNRIYLGEIEVENMGLKILRYPKTAINEAIRVLAHHKNVHCTVDDMQNIFDAMKAHEDNLENINLTDEHVAELLYEYVLEDKLP